MNEQRQHKYEWGQRVIAGIDLLNDGSYPECEEAALLVAKGTVGEVVQLGMQVDTKMPVYLVQFSERQVVGCLEEEIALA